VTLLVRDQANTKEASEVSVRTAGGTVPVQNIFIRTAGGLVQFYRRRVRAAVSPDVVRAQSAEQGTIVTSPVQVSVSGGTPPYSHSWTPNGGISAVQPTSANTQFVGNPPGSSGRLTGTLVDTITDTNGLSTTVSVAVSINRQGSNA
jgi:hypothetical protein